MVGLKRHTVTLASADGSWAEQFEKQRELLLEQLGTFVLEIHHVGSTAIPGLMAKPVIDLAAVISDFSLMPQIAPLLEALGWLDRGCHTEYDHLFVLESLPDIRTHHLHFVLAGSSQLDDYLVFKQRLLSDSNLTRQYMELKKELADKFPNDRKAYTAGKAKFIQAAVQQGKLVK